MKVNLINNRQDKKNRVNFTFICFITAVIIFFSAIFTHYYIMINRSVKVKRQAEEYKNQLELISEKKDLYYELKERVIKLKKIENKLKKYQYSWPLFVKEIGYIVPEKVEFTKIEIEDGLIKLSGYSSNNQNIIKLMKNIETSPIFIDLKIQKLNQEKNIIFQLKIKFNRGEALV